MTLTSKTKLLAAMCLASLGIPQIPQCGGGCRKPTNETKECNREKKNRKAQKKAKKRSRRK